MNGRTHGRSSARQALALVAGLACAGCPGSGGPERLAPLRARPEAPPADASPAPAAPLAPARSGPAPSAAPPTPVRVTVERAPAPGPQDPFRLRRGRAHRLGPSVQVGCRGIEPGAAELEVMVGAMGFPVEARPGTLVPIGPGRAFVERIDAEVALTWRRPLPDARWQARLAPRPAEEGAFLVREASLTRLPCGAWLGVGNLVEVGGELAVTLHAYAPEYEADPAQGFDRFVHARRGERLVGEVAAHQLVELRPGAGDERLGAVLLRPLE